MRSLAMKEVTAHVRKLRSPRDLADDAKSAH
jgi:hypothetical protein